MPHDFDSFPFFEFLQEEELYNLLFKAVQAHNSFTREASIGKGFDRHFLGLRQVLREDETHELFEDPLFAESQTFKLSTSGLSAGDRFFGTGFGAPEKDGYGINCRSIETLRLLYARGRLAENFHQQTLRALTSSNSGWRVREVAKNHPRTNSVWPSSKLCGTCVGYARWADRRTRRVQASYRLL